MLLMKRPKVTRPLTMEQVQHCPDRRQEGSRLRACAWHEAAAVAVLSWSSRELTAQAV